MKNTIDYWTTELSKLIAKKPLRLIKEDLATIPERQGLYRIIKPRSSKTLYIGKSKNIKRRLRSDLLTPNGSHTLKNKLRYDKNMRRSGMIKYLNKCNVQIVTGKKYYITAFEHFAISILEPELND